MYGRYLNKSDTKIFVFGSFKGTLKNHHKNKY